MPPQKNGCLALHKEFNAFESTVSNTFHRLPFSSRGMLAFYQTPNQDIDHSLGFRCGVRVTDCGRQMMIPLCQLGKYRRMISILTLYIALMHPSASYVLPLRQQLKHQLQKAQKWPNHPHHV